ncbi:DUF5067 domain-containing protein [Corynebacterium sp. HS2168-gen11]|uniref:DUF5067 domain-containing protein n=1 Tax=Corynebacterium sp. HS2168-gen11 TaxID=2974027 RepID=UPI00216B3143|nr:DUF5067 domain-containing protein [Corynebacterium sp. HS2168-gen11]MCS4535792.1 DUF5067 domain-containing protein [Corynebacterium sp. HS2168-gen11]
MATPPPLESVNEESQQSSLPLSALAIASFVIGIIALSTFWIPIVNNLIFILALVSLGLGIAAVIVTKKKHTKRRGFAFAIAGTILSILAIVGVLGTQHLYSSALEEALSEAGSPSISDASGDKAKDKATTENEKDDIQISIESLSSPVPNYEGKPAVILTYTVTNNTDENFSVISLNTKAFQNGVSLEGTVFFTDNPEGYNPESSLQEIQPGGTATVTEAFMLSDETSDLDVEIENSFDFISDTKITKTFSLQ